MAGDYANPGLLLPPVDPDIGVAEAGRLHAQDQLAGSGLRVGH